MSPRPTDLVASHLGPALPTWVTPERLTAVFVGTSCWTFLRWCSAGLPSAETPLFSHPLWLQAVVFGLSAWLYPRAGRGRTLSDGAAWTMAASLLYAVGMATLLLVQWTLAAEAHLTASQWIVSLLVAVAAGLFGSLLGVGLMPFVLLQTSTRSHPVLHGTERVARWGGVWAISLALFAIGVAHAWNTGRTYERDLLARHETLLALPTMALGVVALFAAEAVRLRRTRWLTNVARGDVPGLRIDRPTMGRLPYLDDDAKRPRSSPGVLVACRDNEHAYRSPAESHHALARVRIPRAANGGPLRTDRRP